MDKLNYNLDKFTVEPNQRKRYPYEDVGDRLIAHFGDKHKRRIWILFNKHSSARIEHAFILTEEKGITNINYMLAILKN